MTKLPVELRWINLWKNVKPLKTPLRNMTTSQKNNFTQKDVKHNFFAYYLNRGLCPVCKDHNELITTTVCEPCRIKRNESNKKLRDKHEQQRNSA